MFEREKDRNKYFTQLAERGMGEVSGRRIGQQHEGAGQLGTQLEGDWVTGVQQLPVKPSGKDSE